MNIKELSKHFDVIAVDMRGYGDTDKPGYNPKKTNRIDLDPVDHCDLNTTVDDHMRKALPFSGVFRWKGDEVTLLSTDLSGPNGVAFSPDEKYLYVGDWDEKRKVVMRYPVRADGTLGAGDVFHDFTADPGEDAIDGIKVDVAGNVYVSASGGMWILSPQGKRWAW